MVTLCCSLEENLKMAAKLVIHVMVQTVTEAALPSLEKACLCAECAKHTHYVLLILNTVGFASLTFSHAVLSGWSHTALYMSHAVLSCMTGWSRTGDIISKVLCVQIQFALHCTVYDCLCMTVFDCV